MTTRAALLTLGALFALALSLLLYPLIVIQPFRPQGVTELTAALWIVRWRGYFEVLIVVGAVFALAKYWTARRNLGLRISAAVLTVLIAAAAFLTRINIFEKMFHPYSSPAFVAASEAKIDTDDKVLAIAVNKQARAYPIRTIAYHHIINDEVGGLPVVATY